MCRRKDSIHAQNVAAEGLRKVCTARRTYVALSADLLRDQSTLKHLPEPPPDFDGLLDQIDRKAGQPKETRQ